MIHRNFVRSPMQITSSCISASLQLKCVNMTAITWQGHPSQTTLTAKSSPQYTSAWARGRSGTSGHVQEKAPVQLHAVWGAVDKQGQHMDMHLWRPGTVSATGRPQHR
jgi:hypothetical protein